MSVSDALLRTFGADPAVYHPVARAQSRILSRRTPGLGRGGRRVVLKGITPFQFRCFAYAAISVMLSQMIVGATSPIFGVALVLTAGAGLLLLDILVDKFDVLANADEYQVIAAHPHDAWSVIVAKLVTIGRSTAVLAACTFVIPAIGTGLAFHSVAAGAAFVVAAAALSAFIGAGGILFSAILVAAGGRRALMRLMPILHLSYLGFYFGGIMGRDALAHVPLPRLESLGWIQWALPTIWFAAPVEAAIGRAGPAALARGSLALGSFVVLLPLTARWIRTRFDERILEPVRRARPRVSKQGRATTSARIVRGGPLPDWALGIRIFWRLFLAHMRSDAAVRGAVMMAALFPMMMIISTQTGSRFSVRFEGVMASMMSALIVGPTFLVRSATMSTKPTAIWFVLAAPRARAPFSAAVTRLVRIGLVLPLLVIAGLYSALAGTGPLLIRMEFVALMAILADTALIVVRVMNPYVPFSRAFRSKRPFRWSLFAIGAAMLFGLTLFTGVFFALAHWYPGACFIPVVYAAAARVLVGFWGKRRVEREALSAEAA